MHALQRSSFLICLFLAASVIAVYAPVRNYEFVNFDDDLYVTANPVVQKGMTREGVRQAFSAPMNGFWHPLTILSHMSDVQFFGLRPGAHHLVNLLFHIANAILLFLAMRKMTGSVWRSALVAGLFALHPLHVESVAWVSERKDVLSALFWMLAMLSYAAYVQRPGPWRYVAVLILMALGLMAKPMLVTLPFVLLLLDFWPLRRISGEAGSGSTSFPALLAEKIPLFLLSGIASVLALHAQEEFNALPKNLGLQARLWNAACSYGAYTLKSVWPAGLAVPYPHPGVPPLWQAAASLAFLALLTAVVLLGVRKRPFLLVGWLWFLGTLVPVIGLVQVGSHAMADRYTYLPLIGLSIMAAWAVPDPLPRKRTVTALLWGLGGFMLVLFAFGARLQVTHWKDSVSLMARAILVTGPNALAHNNLGMALLSQGKQDEAERHFEESVRIHPEYADALTNLGNIRCRKGFMEEGIELHKKALGIKPEEPRIYNNLGVGLALKGMPREAALCYQEAVRIRPGFAEAWNNLGRTYLDLGDPDGAIDCFRRALTLQPGYVKALTNLGDAKRRKGQMTDAEVAYRQAIALSPKEAAPSYNALATIYGAQGRYKDAIEARNKALALDPDNGATHYFLAVEQYFAGNPELAIQHCERAVALGFRGVEPQFIERLNAIGARFPTAGQ